jgi:hypothetical protein
VNTILPRLKTLIENNKASVGALSYIGSVEVTHPDLMLTTIFLPTLPKVCFWPGKTSEIWVASQRKQAMNFVSAYLIMKYLTRETSIIGDSDRTAGQGKGITNFVVDFISVVRGTRLAVAGTNYLDKPLDISAVSYTKSEISDDAHILIAQVDMVAARLFTQSTLPGDI